LSVDTGVNTILRGRGPRLVGALLLCAAVASSPAMAQPVLQPKLLQALGSEKVRVRIAAVVAVSKSGADNARPILEKMLQDKAAPVRAASLEGLERIGDPKAIAAIRPLVSDKSALVKKIAARALKTLEAKKKVKARAASGPIIRVDLSDVVDESGAGVDGLAAMLRADMVRIVEADGRRNWQLVKGGKKKGYGLITRIRKPKPFKQGDVEGLQVRCDMTVVRMPGKALRLSLNATAGAGVKGKLNPERKPELVKDAVKACAPSLAKDFLDYAFSRPPP
jgi:hypothetical protein